MYILAMYSSAHQNNSFARKIDKKKLEGKYFSLKLNKNTKCMLWNLKFTKGREVVPLYETNTNQPMREEMVAKTTF